MTKFTHWGVSVIIAAALLLCIAFLFVRNQTDLLDGLLGPKTREPANYSLALDPEETGTEPDDTSQEEQATTPAEPEMIRVGFRRIPTDAEEADISYIDVNRLGIDMDDVLSRLPELKKITMIGCGLSNEEYAALQDAHPEVRIVWEIRLSYWTVRTDAKAFSTMKNTGDSYFLYDDEAYYLKYCTELTALDIGHNRVTDLSFLQYMPELRILILVDNAGSMDYTGVHYLSDISMLQYVPKLKYLETFANEISDYSVLENLKDLEHLNISNTFISDITPLTNLPKLQRLWIETTNISYYDYAYLTELYPYTTIVFYGQGSVDQGWRDGPYYEAMRNMFKYNYLDELFE